MVYSVTYRKRNRSETTQSFTDAGGAFNKYYSMAGDATKQPIISSREHVGIYDHRETPGYMLHDKEGKKLAKRRFDNWLNDYKI